MVNWDAFIDSIVQASESPADGQTSDDYVDLLASEYDTAVKTGADVMFRNPVLSGNIEGLKTGLRAAARIGENLDSDDLEPIGRAISAALVLYWLGARLARTTPPPGSTSIVSNNVLFPGAPPPVQLVPTDDAVAYPTAIKVTSILHFMTITGVTIALVPAPPGPPVPTPFPWTGYA